MLKFRRMKKRFSRNQELNDNVFNYQNNGKLEKYVHLCVMCGNCCRNEYKIYIIYEDIKKWQKAGKKELLMCVQIDPTSLSAGYLEAYSKIVQNFGNKYCNVLENSLFLYLLEHSRNFKETKHVKRIEKIKRFILETHNYMGEGLKDYEVPHNLLPSYGYRAVFSPKSFSTLKKGRRLGLKYFLIMELHNKCEFLKENACIIQNYKPTACRNFPYSIKTVKNQNEYNERMQKALKHCHGFSLLKND